MDQNKKTEKKYVCSHCGFTCHRKYNADRHVRTEHVTVKNQECCGMTFVTAGELKKHKAEMHVNGFACGTCSRTFDRKSSLDRHTLSHTKEKRHKCSVCSYAAAWPYNLKRHLEKVHNVMPKKRSREEREPEQKPKRVKLAKSETKKLPEKEERKKRNKLAKEQSNQPSTTEVNHHWLTRTKTGSLKTKRFVAKETPKNRQILDAHEVKDGVQSDFMLALGLMPV